MTETTTLELSDLNTNGFLLYSIKIKRIRWGQMDSTFVTDIYVRKCSSNSKYWIQKILQVVINVLLNNNHKRKNGEFSSPLFSYTANMLIAAGLSI